MARMAERAVFSIHSYRMLAVLEHQLHNRVGIQHDTGDNDGPVWLRIDSLQRFDPPIADDAIKDWLVVSRDPSSPPKVLTTRLVQMPRTDAAKLLAERRIDAPDVMRPSRGRGEDVVDVRLRLDRWPDRQRAIDEYVAGPWRRWADEERPRRETIAIYDRFFSVIQTIEATGAETPSEVVFGVGMVLWRTAARTIEHPLIESLVELDLDPTSRAIRVRPRGIDPELYLKPLEELDNQGVIPLRKAAGDRLAAMAADRVTEGADFSPFDRRSFEPILRLAVTLLSSAGVYHPDTSPGTASRTLPEPDDTLTITDSWAIYVRPRSGNLYVQDIHRLKAEVEGTDEHALPPAAQRFVSRPPDEQVYAPSIDLRGEIGGAGGRRDGKGRNHVRGRSGAGPVLFPKPYNDAQVEIVRRLENAAGVVVQGPPGTGKTHTIANIICHYLATGRSVLVTSKGEPALEVLRDQIPPEVRDLAISLLTSEREGLRQLERAVSFLANDVSNQQPHRIEASLIEREREVAGLQRELDGLDTEIRAFAEQQLGPVAEELAGAPGLLPAELARRVAEGRERYSWLTDRLGPGPVHDPRFSDEDITSARNARRKLGPDLCYLGRTCPRRTTCPTWRLFMTI